MRTLKTLKPGQDGTKALLARYGRSLLCVRYRYDEPTRERVKTVELIVRRSSRRPATPRSGLGAEQGSEGGVDSGGKVVGRCGQGSNG